MKDYWRIAISTIAFIGISLYLIPGIRWYYTMIRNVSFKNVNDCCVPAAGNEVLPDIVLTAIEGLKKMNIRDYRIEGRLQTQTSINPRLTEGAWPIRHNIRSRNAVCYADDIANNKDYTVIWLKNEIAIARCNTDAVEKILTPLEYYEEFRTENKHLIDY